jgi:hypothetical protein
MNDLSTFRGGLGWLKATVFTRLDTLGPQPAPHPACVAQDEYRGTEKPCEDPLPAKPKGSWRDGLRAFPGMVAGLWRRRDEEQFRKQMATAGVDLVPSIRTADGTPVTVLRIQPGKVRLESFFKDGVQTVTPSEVRQMPGLMAGANAAFFGFGEKNGTFGDLRGIGRTYRDELFAANYDAISDKRYHVAIAPDGKVSFGQGGLSERETSGTVNGFVGGMGRLFSEAEGAELQQDVRSGTFDRRLRSMVQNQSFPNTDLTSALPRTLVGRTAEGKLLLVAIGEGRSRGQGAGYAEAALLMRRLGAVEAYTLDGGGSTHVVVPGLLETRTDGRTVKSYLVVTPRDGKRA